MGRPIKKKFFANLNNPYQNHANGGPTGEGGESVVSVTIDTVGSYTSALPTISFGTPDLFSGVVAEGTVHGKALSANVGTRGTGYQIGDLLVQHNGATGTYATWRVTKLRVLTATLGSLPSSQQFDGGENLVWDSGVDDNWTSPTILANIGSTGNPNYDLTGSYASLTGGVWDGYVGGGQALAPTGPLTITGGNTTPNPTNPSYNTRGAGDLRGGSGDNNGYGGTVTFTYGIEEVELVSEGDYTAITSGAKDLDYVSGSGGTGAKATITYGVKNVVIDNPGSHYISAADADATFSTGAAAGTAVLGNTEDNGLAAYAYIIDGNEGVLVDIMKQESSRRYLVKEQDGVQGQCRLVATDASYLNPGEMCLIATDTQGCTYFVTKLTARRAYLTQRSSAGTGYQFADGTSAGWNITGAVTGRVSLANV